MTQSRTFWSAVRWAFVLTFGRRASKALFVFVLAAILGPHDFGVMAIALIYITLLWLLLEQGFMTAVVQREALEPEHLDSAFWLNVAWATVLTGVGVATAGLWADLNNEAQLEPVVQALSILVLIEGLALVQYGLLQRELKFKQLAIRTNIAAAVGGIVGVALALQGAGVWSLVAQQAVVESLALVLIWSMSDWRPRFRFSVRHAKELIPFSFGVFLSNIGGFVSQRSDALLMGIFFGPAVVGIYRLADRFVETLLEATMRPVGLVSLPVLSRAQADRTVLRDAVERCLRAAVLLTVPAMLVLAACSDELMRLIGPEWAVGADALKLLAVAGIAKAIAYFTGPVLFAVARSHLRAATQWALGAVSAGAVVLVGTLLVDASLSDQLVGMSASRVVLLALVVAPINLVIVSRVTGYRLRDIVRLLPAPLVAGAGALVATTVLRELGLFAELPSAVALAVSGGVAVLVAVGILTRLEPNVRAVARFVWGRASGRAPTAEPPWRTALPSE